MNRTDREDHLVAPRIVRCRGVARDDRRRTGRGRAHPAFLHRIEHDAQSQRQQRGHAPAADRAGAGRARGIVDCRHGSGARRVDGVARL